MNQEYIETDKVVNSVKDDGGSIPYPFHSSVYACKNWKGDNVEYFKDAYGKYLPLDKFIRDGFLEYAESEDI